MEYVELDLSRFKGCAPVEVFGQNPFPRIGELPYLLTLGPYAFYWFRLDPGSAMRRRIARVEHERIVQVTVRGRWDAIARGDGKEQLEQALPDFLQQRRWFAGKGRNLRSATVLDLVVVPANGDDAGVLLVQVDYDEGPAETYALPVIVVTGAEGAKLRADRPDAVLVELEVRQGGETVTGVLADGLRDKRLPASFAAAVLRRRQFKGSGGRIVGTRLRALPPSLAPLGANPDTLAPAQPLEREQSNSSVAFDRQVILKVFRRVSEGVNPELEMGRFLAERTEFRQVAPLVGALEYVAVRQPPMTVGVLQGFVPNEGDAWQFTLDQVRGYFERVLGLVAQGEHPPTVAGRVLDLTELTPPARVGELFGAYLETARLLGQRTAELHVALASRRHRPGLRPGAVHHALPAVAVPVDAQPHGARPGAPARAAGHAGPGSGPRRAPAAEPGGAPARDLPHHHREPDRRDPHPLPRRLPPRPGAAHRQATS